MEANYIKHCSLQAVFLCFYSEYGGLGLDYKYQAALLEESGHMDCGGIPMAYMVQTVISLPALTRFGSDRLKKEFLEPSIKGDYVACLGVSEPGAGSDVANITVSVNFQFQLLETEALT